MVFFLSNIFAIKPFLDKHNEFVVCIYRHSFNVAYANVGGCGRGLRPTN